MLEYSKLCIFIIISLAIHSIIIWNLDIEYNNIKPEVKRMIVRLIPKIDTTNKPAQVKNRSIKNTSKRRENKKLVKMATPKGKVKKITKSPPNIPPPKIEIKSKETMVMDSKKSLTPPMKKLMKKDWYGIAKKIIQSDQNDILKQGINATNFFAQKSIIQKEKFLFKRQLGKKIFSGFGIPIFKNCFIGFKAIDYNTLESEARKSGSMPGLQGPFTCDF